MLDIIAQTALANIQINRPNPFTGVQKRGNQVHGNSGFARPALLIADDNNKRTGLRRNAGLRGCFILAGLVQNFSFIFCAFDYKPDS